MFLWTFFDRGSVSRLCTSLFNVIPILSITSEYMWISSDGDKALVFPISESGDIREIDMDETSLPSILEESNSILCVN